MSGTTLKVQAPADRLDFYFYLWHRSIDSMDITRWTAADHVIDVRLIGKGRPDKVMVFKRFFDFGLNQILEELSKWLWENGPVFMRRQRTMSNLEYMAQERVWLYYTNFPSFTLTWKLNDGSEQIDYIVGNACNFFRQVEVVGEAKNKALFTGIAALNGRIPEQAQVLMYEK